jgi:hypothetical protein
VSIQEISPNSASKTSAAEIRKCYTGSGCDETFTNVLTVAKGSKEVADQVALTTYPIFTYTGTDFPSNLVVTPTANTDVGTYYFRLTSTTVSGNAATSRQLSYYAAVVTIDCTVVSITAPAAPSTNLEYIVFDANLNIDLIQRGLTFVQVPDC